MSDKTGLGYDISKLKTVADCRRVMQRARAKGLTEIYAAAFHRQCILVGNEHDDPNDPLVRAFFEMLAAYEQLLSEKNGKNQPAQRTRQKVQNKGVVQSLIEWTRSPSETAGFKALVAEGLYKFTGEFVVLRFAERFPPDVVTSAKARLTKHDLPLPH